MAWIRITEKFSWIATPATTIVYKPGEYNVPSACATLAVAAGKAIRLKKTNKNEEPQPWPSEAQEPALSETASLSNDAAI